MQPHLEVELKWALCPAGHQTLCQRLPEALGQPAILEQDNRFFDSADRRLLAALCNIRLRTENGRMLMTCKRKVAAVDEAHRHEEWETWLEPALVAALATPDADLAALLPLPEPVRTALAGAPLRPLGGFANLRLEFHDGDSLLCLDRTTFPSGRVDHELEIETTNPVAVASAWKARLDEWGVEHQPQLLTKFARYRALTTK